jgi:hypothetical protein
LQPIVSLQAGRSLALAALRLPTIAILLCAMASKAWGLGEQPGDVLIGQVFSLTSTERQGPQLEMSARSLPRFDNTDGATHSSRIDMSLLAPRPSALGLSLGMTSLEGPGMSAGRPFASASPGLDVGLHWRYTSESNYRFDVTAWRRMNAVDTATLIQNRESTYGARVEMRVASVPKSGFVADRGFLGFQLESGARITLRKGGGGKPMVYYRTKF